MKKLLAAVTVAGVFTAGVALGPGAVSAQDSHGEPADSTSLPAPFGEIEIDDETQAKLDACDALFDDVFGAGMDFLEVFPDEDLSEINAETQTLIDSMIAAGLPVEVVDADGFVGFELGELTEAQAEILDSVFDEAFGADLPELTASELADMNAEEEALASHLESSGVSFERITEEDGFVFIDIDWDDESAVEIYNSYWNDLYDISDEYEDMDEETEAALEECDNVYESIFDGFDFDEDLSEEDLAEMNAETQKLIDAMEKAGISVDVSEEDGFLDYEFGELTEEQEAALDQIFEDEFASMLTDLSDEDKADMNAEEEAIAAHLDEAGISYTMVDLTDGVKVVEIDWDDEAAFDAYISFWDDLDFPEFDDEGSDDESDDVHADD